MKPAILAVLLLALPATALAQAPDPFARGTELRVAGRAAEAAPLLEQASKLRPGDADVWLNLGLAHSATGRFDQARRALEEADRLSPNYPDVQIALARLAYFRKDYAAANRLLAPALAAQPTNAGAIDLSAQISAAERQGALPWRLDVALNHGALSNGLPSASGAAVVLARRFSSGVTLSGGVDHQRQFGRSDTYFEAVAANRYGYVALGGTPDADFRPELAVRGGVTLGPKALTGDWTVELAADGGWARYPAGEVLSLHPSVTLARGEGLSFTARWINVIDEFDRHRSGYQVRGVWRAAPRVALSAGYADAPETTEGATTDVRAVSLGVAYDLDARTTVRLSGEHSERAAYDRDDIILGLTRRF